MNKGEIILYQPDDTVSVEVRLKEETVWLTQAQIAELFDTARTNIVEHIKHIYEENELDIEATCRDFRQVRVEGDRQVTRTIPHYDLDMIISIGYRVNSKRATQFRRWATKVLKDYVLKGYAVRPDMDVAKLYANHENRITELEKNVDFFVKTSLPPKEGVFFNGQIFDAYVFASNLIKSAKKTVILIDNYVDESVLVMLSDRKSKVTAQIYTWQITEKLKLSREKYISQYEPIAIDEIRNVHDRFLIIDNTVYHIGASLKDLGKKLFAFSKMEIKPAELLKNIDGIGRKFD
jgi:hypothetical protein